MRTAFILYALTAGFVFIFGIINIRKGIDFQFHDTYVATAYLHVAILVCFLLGVNAIIFRYLSQKRKPDTITSLLSILHFFLTTLMLVVTFYPATNHYALVSDTPVVLINRVTWEVLLLFILSVFLLVVICVRARPLVDFDKHPEILDQ